jgi:hypothetical protein
MYSLNKVARMVGFLILALVLIAPFGMLIVPAQLVVTGDATATAGNIRASEGLLRAGIASDAVVFLIEIMLTVLIYTLLKPVNKTLSLIAAFARLAMTVVQGMNLLNYFMVLSLMSGADYLAVFSTPQLEALVLLFLDLHEAVALIWGLFFALHLLVSGYLVYQSGYIHKVVGILLMIAGLCYVTQSFGNVLFPQLKGMLTTIGLFSMVELAFPLWLLFKGVRTEKKEGEQ